MATYLLTWNPTKYDWDDLEENIEHLNTHDFCDITWSCSRTKRILKGDRIFLIRLGKEPKGIVASGISLSAPYLSEYWNKEQANEGRQTNYVDVRLDTLLNAETEPILFREQLDKYPFNKVHWNTQNSGILIEETVAKALEDLWTQLKERKGIGPIQFGLPEEEDRDGEYYEGAVTTAIVNKYERDTRARNKCIQHYGYNCFICGFNFHERYGAIGKGFIHVHHLKPLSEIGEQYKVDPVRDLRPICPNCHSMIHIRKPAYSIEEIKGLMEDNSVVSKGLLKNNQKFKR